MELMTVGTIVSSLELKIISPGDGVKVVEGVIAGDLLGYILGEARKNWAWVTIQVHLNVAAVAVLKELPLILLASGRAPQDDLAAKCKEEGITLVMSPLPCYELCCELYRLGLS